MIDSNKTSTRFKVTFIESYLVEGSSSTLGITTSKTDRESFYCSYASNSKIDLSYSLDAGYLPYGSLISITFNDLSFSFDLKLKAFNMLYFETQHKDILKIGDTYEYREPINSKIEFLSTYKIDNKTYSNILHFTLNDFKDNWNKFTVREIYFAKGIGLIKYTLNNGLSAVRTN